MTTPSAISASQQVQALRFSSITQKTQNVEDVDPKNPQNQRKLNLSLNFRDLTSSRPEFSRLVDYQAKDNNKLEEMRVHLTYPEKSDVSLSLIKKSKKTSKLLPRNALFTTQKKDVLHFSQDRHKKSYITPKVYYPETKAQYDLKMKDATTAIQKKKILPWAANDAGDFRITFIRRPGTTQDQTPDSAFYFKQQLDFEKTKNYFKSIELLEGRKDFYSQNGLLDRLTKGFKGYFAARMRYLIGMYAKNVKTEQRFRKEDAVHRSVRYFHKLQRDNVKGFIDYWRQIATGLDNQKQTEQKSIKNRQEHILQTVQRVSILRDLDSYLVGAVLEAWKNEAEERIESPKQDITLYFETLELTGIIVQPVMKVEVLIGNQYPVELIVNQKTIPKTNDMVLDFDLNCKLKGLKNTNAFYWKLNQKQGVSKESDQSSEDFFAIHFEDFLIEHLDNVQIKINIFDESATKKAYHYASLRNFYEARKGNNIWLCLDKSQDIDKFPLLQMKVDAGFVDKAHRNYNLGPFIPPAYGKDTITDPFYSYEFNIPTITPKHEKFLSLFPQRWNVIDEKIKELKRSGKLGDFVQTVKTRFAKHYYETSSKQIARLKKTAYLWAELQEELIMNNYKPIKNKGNNNDNSQLCVDEKYINNLEGLQRPIIEEGHDDDSRYEQHDELNDIVSYLFKRDKWESRKEWKYYYNKLQELCRKGIPPQSRLGLWSELGRVVYFINLTKNEHKKHRAFQLYSKANYGSEKDLHASHDENLAERSQRVYERLKSDAEREYVFLYQELEEDLEILRADLGIEKRKRIPHEQHIRDICRTFIYWAKLFSDPGRGEKVKYYVVYSRAILILCHGLITCQTCNYLEREVDVQEDQIFWLLISLASYIVSSYFETNEGAVSVDKLTIKETDTTPVNRAKNKITNSGLRCSQLKGIKCDLLILKILLKENENEVFSKFEELGLPLEYYFAEHMLTLFINLFNPGLTFRIWDILFFEGSSANQVRCNRMMISFLYVLLRECKPMLLKAKNAVDIKFIIETYARFQTRHGAFVREAYKVAQVHFEQTLPDNEKVLDKLSYIKYALFTLKYNILDNKVNAIEKTIQENYFSLTLKQNMAVYNLATNKYSYKPHGQLEILSYAVLAKMIKDFQASYGTKRLLSQGIGLSLKNYLTTDTRQPGFNQSPQGNQPHIPGLSPMGYGTNAQPGYNQGHKLNSGYDDRYNGRTSHRANINPNEGFDPINNYGGDLNNSQYRYSPGGRVNVNAGAGGNANLNYSSNLGANYGPNDLNANNLNRSSPLRNQSPTSNRGNIFQNQAQPLTQGQGQGQGQFYQGQNQPQGQFLQGQTQGQGQFYQGQNQPQGQFLQGQTQGQGVIGLDGRTSYDPNRSPLRQLQEVTVDPRKFLKGKINYINVKIHKLILYSPNLNTLALYVIYGKEKVKKQDFSSLEVDFEAIFNLNNIKEATRFINIEIYDEKDPKNPQKIKYLNIDLKRIILDTPTKLNLKFKEENPYIYNDNFITSEIEMTVLLNGPGFKTGANYSNFPVVPELENHIYDHFRDLRLGEELPPTVLENEYQQPTATPHGASHAFSQNRYAWKENFAVAFEEFMSIIRNIAPFWLANTNFREIFESIKAANRNGNFYITDFFILLILCGKFTSTQKFRLLFDLLTGFDDAIPDSKNEMPMHTLRGLSAHIYNLFMLYMPYNELENLVDLATTGNLPAIKKVIINDKTSANTEQSKQFLNRLANYIHLNFNTREIHLYHPQILSLLREYYEKEVLTAASTRSFTNNKVEITYITNGMAHKIKIETDSNWNIIGDPKLTRGTANAQPKVLDLYKHVIALQNTPVIFDRPQFIKVMQKLPLLNYLCSLEHSEVSNVLTELGSNIRFTIFMRGEPVFTAIPSIDEINHKHVLPDDPSKKLKKFSSLIRDWDDVVKTCSNTQTQQSNRYRDNRNTRKYAIEARKLPATKLNIFFSYEQIITYLKKNIIKTISGYVDKQLNATDQFNASLFNKNLYDLEYSVSLNIDNERDIKVTDKNKSPFKTLIEKIEAQGSNKDIRNLEIMFNLDERTIKESFAENYDQLALYRYADGSTEWLPCKLRYKFQYLKNMSKTSSTIPDDKIDGFGVIFARYPEETIVKRRADVAIIQQVDFVELESRQVDPATMKAVIVTGNQYAQVENDKRRVVKSFATGVYKGAARKRFNASDFDEGDGRLNIRPTTWDFISDDAHKIVKRNDPGIYKGTSRRNYNASDLVVDDGKIKRLATQKDDLRKIKRGQPGQFRGLKRTNYYAGDLVEENYKFAKDPSSNTPPQSRNATGKHVVGSQLGSSPSLQRGLTHNAKRVVQKGEPGKYKGTEKDHFHAGDLEDEFPIKNQTSLHPNEMYQSGGYYASPQRRSANYEQQLKKSGSPGVYQGMERRSYNAGDFDEIDENVRGGFDVRQKDYNVANMNQGYGDPYDTNPRNQNYNENRDLRSSQYGQNYARPGDSGVQQGGRRTFNSGLPEDNQYRDDYRYDGRDQRDQYNNYGQNVYDRDQGNYPYNQQDRNYNANNNYHQEENMFASGNQSKQTGIFGTRSHQVNPVSQSGYQDRYQSNYNTRGGYAAETDEISGKVSFNR